MTHDIVPADSRRRKLLWSVPAGLVGLQGCGGGGTAEAATTLVSAPVSGTPASTGAIASPAPAISSVKDWASRANAAASQGVGILVPDVGVGGSLWLSNGTAWVPVSNPLVLAHRYAQARMDASVGAHADVLLDSQRLPAYLLGTASALRISAAYSLAGDPAANKAPQIRAWFGIGSYASSSIPLLDTRGQFSDHKSVLLHVTLQNCDSLAVNQIRPYDYAIGASRNAFATSAIDFSQDVTIGFGAMNNSASVSPSDQQVLNWFTIELLS